ncbi:hypothetical protein INR75_02875 [Zunongwangia sp. SCSIO 43204]|uniref:hypothetical protein n=1 Tax=Zunongwangia sp. SCSIO 43204 TaxID=2779359 RepID=UPI001CA820BD|nr:hypothetical protein [Zunongwangia sp. SCSIO 43204]UAB84990.1 hypothetical protein INR75_02875 [Zunongwangia sp. SCSIO 43204]
MKRLLLLIILFSTLSCGTTQFIKTGFDETSVMPALPEDAKVSIITELPENAKRIVEIGICKGSVPGGGMIKDRSDKAIEKLKECARKNGGNAILLKESQDGGFYTTFGYSQQVAKAQGQIYFIEL